MKRQKQLFKHDPDNGVYGDCYRAAIACILGLNAVDVPHFNSKEMKDSRDQEKTANAWLVKNHNLGLVHLPLHGDTEFSDVLKICSGNSIVPFIVSGKSPRGVSHCVVAMNGAVYCDPHSGLADDDPFVGPCDCTNGDQFWFVEYLTYLPKHPD